jgi:hypothetical protein
LLKAVVAEAVAVARVAVKAAMAVVKAVKVLAVVRVVPSKVEEVRPAAKTARVKKTRISISIRTSTVIRKVTVDRVAGRMHPNRHQRLLQLSKKLKGTHQSPKLVPTFLALVTHE